MPADIDAAAIMAAHHWRQIGEWQGVDVVEMFCVECGEGWPCLPHRLAAALHAAEEREGALLIQVRGNLDGLEADMAVAWDEGYVAAVRDAGIPTIQSQPNPYRTGGGSRG